MAGRITWRDVLAPELVKQVDQELNQRFMEGWNAYKRAAMALEPPDSQSRERILSLGVATESDRSYPATRAPRGFWSGLLEEALRERPNGLRQNDALLAVQSRTREFTLSRSSLNVAIHSLEREGRARRDGRTLYWVPPHGANREPKAAPAEEPEAEANDEPTASAISLFRELENAAA